MRGAPGERAPARASGDKAGVGAMYNLTLEKPDFRSVDTRRADLKKGASCKTCFELSIKQGADMPEWGHHMRADLGAGADR